MLMFSIKPKWAEMISVGSKTLELRRRPPPAQAIGKIAFIYASAPTSGIICICRVEDIISDEKERLWLRYGLQTGCTKSEFDLYFSGCEIAKAIKLTLLELPFRRLKLAELKREYRFAPPQSWRWATELSHLVEGE